MARQFRNLRAIDGGNETGEAWRARAGELAFAITRIREATHTGGVSIERLPEAISAKLAAAESAAADLRRRLAEAEKDRGKFRAILEQIQGKRTSAARAPYAHVGQTVLDAIDAALAGEPKKEGAAA